MRKFSFRKKLGFFVILFAFIGFLSLLLAELYIRFSQEYTTPAILRSQSLQYEPTLFSRTTFPRLEQNLDPPGYYINHKGYRGRDFSIPKKTGKIRIIVYGGSAAFDQNVPEGKDWPHRFEGLLHEMGGTQVEVINAGIPGNASIDSFGRFFSEGHLFEPDFVLLYNAWNDIKYFSTKGSLLRTYKSHPVARDPRTNYQGLIDQTLCELSQLYVRLRSRFFYWKYSIGEEGIIPAEAPNRNIQDLPVKQYRVNIEMFVDLARNIGAIPILMTQARLISPTNTKEEKKHIRYNYVQMDHQTLLSAFQKTDEIIRQVAQEKHAFFIDSSQQLSGQKEYFTDQVHLTDAGSMKLAQITATFLGPLVKEWQKNKNKPSP